MNKTTKKVLSISGWLLTISGVFVLLGFVSGSQQNMLCNELVIRIDDGRSELNFINKEQIVTKIAENGNAVVGEPMSKLNVTETEAMIQNMSSVEHAEVYKTIAGKVVVEVQQRHPIVRIINADSTSFYIDDKGRFMPLSPYFTARVLIVNGHIQEAIDSININEIASNDSLAAAHLSDDVFAVANYINGNPFWKAQVQHIWITPKGDMEIIPRVGNHRIIFGSSRNMEQKFKKLKVFYSKALKNEDWNIYETINLKYDNQIVCTKNQ